MIDNRSAARAAAAYRASQQLDTSPAKVLGAVHGRLMRAVSAVKIAYDQGALEEMCRAADQATSILACLSLVAANGAGPDGAALRAFYRWVQKAIDRIQMDAGASADLHESLKTIQEMHHNFHLISSMSWIKDPYYFIFIA